MRRGIGVAQIESLYYDPDTKVLEMRFMRVGHYEYAGVPGDIGYSLMNAMPSEAVHIFDTKVEGKYKSRRIGN